MITDDKRERYGRQLPLFGEAGQENLQRARVFVAGVGGLGSVIAVYLAAAGVGTLRVADDDVVESSNFNRQILHWHGDLGRPKTASAMEKLSALNPCGRVEEIQGRIEEAGVDEMIRDCDLIVDAVDNFPTRYILNRAALRRGIPFVHGAVRGFFGQATTVIPGKGPCLRCVFPAGPPPESPPIVGATCGVIGSLEALEAIKILTGKGETLIGRLFLWDGLTASADTLSVERNPACPDCGGPTG